jgi:hypothetical protein
MSEDPCGFLPLYLSSESSAFLHQNKEEKEKILQNCVVAVPFRISVSQGSATNLTNQHVVCCSCLRAYLDSGIPTETSLF